MKITFSRNINDIGCAIEANKDEIDGVRRKDNPNVYEMRTFLSDKNMTPTKLRRYEELRERVDDESFIAESYNLSVWGSIYKKNNMPIPKE